jgi:hypothetical protein
MLMGIGAIQMIVDYVGGMTIASSFLSEGSDLG